MLLMLLVSDDPFELLSLVVPFVEADDDIGDGNDFGETDPFFVPFSLRMRNLCSPFCCVVGIAPALAAFVHAFEQYGLYLSFPLLSFLPH